jgi:hypothetical protein
VIKSELSLDELTQAFRVLGADEPEIWAESEYNEDIPQRSRYALLSLSWRQLIDNSKARLSDTINSIPSPSKFRESALKLAETLEKDGVQRGYIEGIIMIAQIKMLSDLLYLIDEGADNLPPGLDISWGLYEKFDSDNPGRPIGGLRESLEEVWPSDHTILKF